MLMSIIATLMFVGITYAAIISHEITWIIACVLFGIFDFIIIQSEFNKKSKIPWNSLLAIYVCLVLFGITTVLLVINVNDRLHSNPISATIISIEHDDNDDDDSAETCTAYVDYMVDGKVYNAKYESSSLMCKKKIGRKVKIYYRTDNPQKITTTRNIIFITIGVLLSGFSSVVMIKKTFFNPGNN